MACADQFSIRLCDGCGLFASRKKKRDNKSFTTSKDVYECIGCHNSTRISTIRIPYSFKLFITELMALNILPRLRTKGSKYDSQLIEEINN